MIKEQTCIDTMPWNKMTKKHKSNLLFSGIIFNQFKPFAEFTAVLDASHWRFM